MNAKFLNFIKLGQLGPLRLGLSKGQVLDFIGEPHVWDGKPGGFRTGKTPNFLDSLQWTYSEAFGVTFDSISQNSGVCEIFVFPTEYRPNWFKGFFPTPSTRFSEVKRLLVEVGIPFLEGGTISNNEGFYLAAGNIRIEGKVDKFTVMARMRELGLERFASPKSLSQVDPMLIDDDKVVWMVRCGKSI